MTEILYKQLSFAVVGAAMEVHRILGSGFLEAVYQTALQKELSLRGIPFRYQVELPVKYKDEFVGIYKADLIVDEKIIVEIKSVSHLNSAHDAQAIHYLSATGLELALLLNFGGGSLVHRRVVKTNQRSVPVYEVGG